MMRNGLRIILGCAVLGGCVEKSPSSPVPAGLRSDFEVLLSGAIPPDSLAPTDSRQVYLSLQPGAVPGGAALDARNRRTRSTRRVALSDGGLDPIAFEAQTGDTFDLSAVKVDGSILEAVALVAPSRSPAVVRTIPSRGKKSVPLNARIIIVFSEPLDLSSLAAGAVQLLLGAEAVPGSASFTGADRLSISFVPASDLRPDREYTILVTTEVRNLEGRRLETPFTSTFVTEPELPDVAFIAIDPPIAVLRAGGTLQMSAVLLDSSGNVLTGRNVAWSSSDPRVATVSAGGLVTTVDAGTAEISVQSEGITATSHFTVLPGRTAALVVSTVTTGVDVDADGYLVAITFEGYGFPSGPMSIAANGSIRVDSLVPGAGVHPVWLAGLDPNCSVADDLPAVNLIAHGEARVTFAVTCVPRSTLGGDGPLVGAWQAMRYDYFLDSALTTPWRGNDWGFGCGYGASSEGALSPAGTVSSKGTLMVRRATATQVRWEWREDCVGMSPHLTGGVATIDDGTLRSVVDRWAVEYECDADLPTCRGSLNGPYAYIGTGDELVITGLQAQTVHEAANRFPPAWMRITLKRLR